MNDSCLPQDAVMTSKLVEFWLNLCSFLSVNVAWHYSDECEFVIISAKVSIVNISSSSNV